MARNLRRLAGGLVAAAGVLFALFPGSLFLLLALEFPIGIHDEEELVRHFAQNRRGLEGVVEEALALGIGSATRASWSVLGRRSHRPAGREYEPLFRAMRRARVEQVWVKEEVAGTTVTLITDTIQHMIDREYFGYLWISGEALEAAGEDPSEQYGDRDRRLDPHWFLYWFRES